MTLMKQGTANGTAAKYITEGLIDKKCQKWDQKIDRLDGSPHERGAEKVYVPCLIYICIRLKHKHQIPLEKVAKLQGIF